MTPSPLACTVRGCGEPLTRQGRAFVCGRGHSHDVARSGYVNLLQPQDKKSPRPGDTSDAVEARAALEESGVGRALLEAVMQRVERMALVPGAVVLDLGSGTGYALRTVCMGRDVTAVGIDLSVAAATYAARHWPGATWVVANADRTLPVLDDSVDLVMSLHARRHPTEVTRVLKPGGRLIVAVPGPDDLIEVRTAVQGSGVMRDRVAALVSDHEALFTLEEQSRVSSRLRLPREALVALLAATYRGARHSAAPIVEALSGIEVTLASDLCIFRPRPVTR